MKNTWMAWLLALTMLLGQTSAVAQAAEIEIEETTEEATTETEEALDASALIIPEKLTTPSDFEWYKTILSWEPTPYAESYYVEMHFYLGEMEESSSIFIDEPSIDVADMVANACQLAQNWGVEEPTEFVFHVTAYPSEEDVAHTKSDYEEEDPPILCLPDQVPSLSAPTSVKWNEKTRTLTWNPVPGASSYRVTVYGRHSFDIEYDFPMSEVTTQTSLCAANLIRQERSYVLSEFAEVPKNFYITVAALSGDLIQNKSSDETKALKISSGGNYKWIAAPKNLENDGLFFTWNPVKSATSYLLNVGVYNDARYFEREIEVTTTYADVTDLVENLATLCYELSPDSKVYASVDVRSKVGDGSKFRGLYSEDYIEIEVLPTGRKQPNTITAEDISLTYSAKPQTAQLAASCQGGARLFYKSDNASVKVDNSGNLIISKGFVGAANITVSTGGSADYYQTEKQVKVVVKPIITVKPLEIKSSAKTRTYSLGAKITGKAALSYSVDSEQDGISIDAKTGKLTVDGWYAGEAEVTVTAIANDTEIEKKVVPVKVLPLLENEITTGEDVYLLTYSMKAQTLPLKTTVLGKAKVKYTTNNKRVKVTSGGKVTIPAKFTGSVEITITTTETKEYYPAVKTVTLQVES